MKSSIIDKILTVQPDNTFINRKSNLQYFIQNDICESLLRELIVSVFRYYKCQIICDSCFIKNNQHVKEDIYDNYDKLINCVKLLDKYVLVIDNADDIKLIRTKYPHLYEVINQLSSFCYYSNNILKINELINSNEINKFKGIYEISCFTSQLNIKNYEAIIYLLQNKLTKIKVILDEYNNETLTLLNKIYEKYPTKITLSQKFNNNYHLVMTLSTNLALMYDEFTFAIRYDNTNPAIFKLDDLVNDIANIPKIVQLICNAKIKRYERYLTYVEDKLSHLQEIEYMRWVVDNIKINLDYNFIMKDLVSCNWKLDSWFKQNWRIIDNYGYYNHNVYKGKLIPLFGVKNDNT